MWGITWHKVEEPDAHDEAPSPLGGRWNCTGGWISLTAGGVVDLSSLTDRPWHQLIRPSPRDRWIFWGRRLSGIWDVIEKKKLLFQISICKGFLCIISVWQMRSRNQVMTWFWWGDDGKKKLHHITQNLEKDLSKHLHFIHNKKDALPATSSWTQGCGPKHN